MDSNVCMIDDFSDLKDLVEKSRNVEADVFDEIKDLLARRSEIEHKLKKINSLIPDFHKLQVNAENSSKLVGCASKLALQLSGKVEQLDFVKADIKQCNLTDDFKKKSGEISKCFENSQLVCQVQDLLSKYLNLEQYYLRVTIMKMCITELKVSISDQLQALLDSAFEHLSTSVIQSEVKTLLNVFKSLKYD
uniref:Biogenesis of lysosome-related organelles complex 1 subunit 7 n=1 Tax=Schistosoma mansoni TaxID=6183 RepID=A0A5K4F4S9_SCHMA